MYTYETIFITSPSLAEDVERTTVETLTAIVTDAGGTIHANYCRAQTVRRLVVCHGQSDGCHCWLVQQCEV